MTISTIISNAAPVGSVRGNRSGEERRGTVAQDAAARDRVSFSGQAHALYAADQSKKLDVIRERVRRGYYLDGYVTEQVVDSVAREIEAAMGR
jgi:hypothetical protein